MSAMMQVKILFFATLRAEVGSKSIEFELPEGSTIGELRAYLAEQYPMQSDGFKNALATMDYRYCADDEIILQGAEVAFFPPVSGGSDVQEISSIITSEALDFNTLIAEMIDDTTGAICIFAGVVRGTTPDGDFPETQHLEYDAYQPMAELKMQEIGREIKEQWQEVKKISLVQRIGKLEKGEPSVFVACTSSHRVDGIFEAARFGIDRLKEVVPVWKKEVSSSGEQWIEGEYHPKPDSKRD